MFHHRYVYGNNRAPSLQFPQLRPSLNIKLYSRSLVKNQECYDLLKYIPLAKRTNRPQSQSSQWRRSSNL
jgi:hypothetical protein